MGDFDIKLINAKVKLGSLFDIALASWLEHFKFDIAVEDWLKKSDVRYGVQKYMDYLLRFLEIEYYYASLAQKKAELESKRGIQF